MRSRPHDGTSRTFQRNHALLDGAVQSLNYSNERCPCKFVVSNTKVDRCPKAKMPEYAFIGRSNVGKSSLINMLCNQKKLAKTSSRPGKTQLINHFLINKKWYLVDLPGYGYARASKTQKKTFKVYSRLFYQRKIGVGFFDRYSPQSPTD